MDVGVCWKEYMSCVWVKITPDVVIKTYISALVNKHVCNEHETINTSITRIINNIIILVKSILILYEQGHQI